MRSESRIFSIPLWRALRAGACVALGASSALGAAAEGKPNGPSVIREKPVANPQLDHTGRKRVGKASFYAPMFAGRKMANGNRMDPHGNNAASKTLPLGTTAKVTNLETGTSAVGVIQDRGPYVPGRIVDLSPATAQEIGLTRRKGVAMVVVAPIAVPQPDGAVKLGAAAREPVEQTTVTTAMRDASVFREASAADERTALR